MHRKIKDHKVFHHHTGTGRQETSQIRISAVIFDILAFLGIEGCGLSNRKAYHQFPSGQGSFELYKERYVTAILDLQIKAYFWPDPDKHKMIATFFSNDYKVPNVLLLAMEPYSYLHCHYFEYSLSIYLKIITTAYINMYYAVVDDGSNCYGSLLVIPRAYFCLR